MGLFALAWRPPPSKALAFTFGASGTLGKPNSSTGGGGEWENVAPSLSCSLSVVAPSPNPRGVTPAPAGLLPTQAQVAINPNARLLPAMERVGTMATMASSSLAWSKLARLALPPMQRDHN